MAWKKYNIFYINPNIGDKLRILRVGGMNSKPVIINARNQDEAERRAEDRLRTTGMWFNVKEVTQ